MNVLSGLRRRAVRTRGGADPSSADGVAIEGYDRLADWKVISRLPELSQEELTGVETHERAHRCRPVVLDKLRYLRGPEPLEGYDALTAEQMPAALGDLDLATVDDIRFYERRLRNRESVLAEIERVRGRLRRPPDVPVARSSAESAAWEKLGS